MTKDEIQRLEAYLRKLFNRKGLEVRRRAKKDDSAEVYIDDEFIGVLFRDEEDGELTYQLQIAILDFDLE